MKKTFAFLAVTMFWAGTAQAEWVLRSPEASDDNGSAYVENEQGHRLDIGCGNGGLIGISLTPDTRPEELMFVDDGAVIFFRVDGAEPGLQMPATCGPHGCYQDFMLGGEPWPVSQMRDITSALRAGTAVDVTLGGQVMSTFDLTGSAAALDGLKTRTSCDGL